MKKYDMCYNQILMHFLKVRTFIFIKVFIHRPTTYILTVIEKIGKVQCTQRNLAMHFISARLPSSKIITGG